MSGLQNPVKQIFVLFDLGLSAYYAQIAVRQHIPYQRCQGPDVLHTAVDDLIPFLLGQGFRQPFLHGGDGFFQVHGRSQRRVHQADGPDHVLGHFPVRGFEGLQIGGQIPVGLQAFRQFGIPVAGNIDLDTLQEAITATFENRGTAISTEYSLFEDSFATDAKRNIMWNSYLKKIKFKEPLTFQEVWTYITQELKQYMEK